MAIGGIHRQALGDALDELRLRDLKPADMERLSKADDACWINSPIATRAYRTIWVPNSCRLGSSTRLINVYLTFTLDGPNHPFA